MNIQTVINDYNKTKDDFLVRKGKYETLLKTKADLINQKTEKTKAVKILEQAKLLIAESSKYAKKQVKTQLESLVTSGLQYVFGDDRRFEIEISEGKNRTEAEFYHITIVNGEEIRSKPEEANGGGVVDIICIILRIAMLQSFNQPTVEGPLILDEPVKMVSAEYIDKVGEFLQQLKQFFGRQIIMSTHNMYLSEIADKKYLVTQTDGISRVESLAA